MGYTGPERRKHPRIVGRFVVSYRLLKESDNLDISQTKNLSLGGMLLTTNKKFAAGTILILEIRLPFDADLIKLVARVIDSSEVTKDLIYDTRLEFIDVGGRHKKIIGQTVEYYLKRGKL